MPEDKKEDSIQIVLPVGRLINGALFERDVYVDPSTNKEGTPQYKAEIAFDPEDLIDAEDQIVDACVKKWGAKAEEWYDDEEIVSPILDGDTLASRRAKKGKEGTAYEGKLVIRAHTQFNKNGDAGPGGIDVYDEDVEAIDPINKHKIYNGCYGIAAVTVGFYKDSKTQKDAITLYLNAFQKTADGEKLSSGADYSKVFQKVEKPAGESAGRRRRRG